MKKPRVITKCVANTYTDDNERIIEYTDPVLGVGGLISLRRVGSELRVQFYRHEDNPNARVENAKVVVLNEKAEGR